MASEKVPAPLLPDIEKERKLEVIRQQAEQYGRVGAVGIRPVGAPFPQASPELGYYGTPTLKEPQWSWEIPLYFFVGGAAGASAVIATVAEWIGGNPELARRARLVALGGAAVSSVLLISDLGRPERFLAMLRVLKPQSPMSMGSWILAAFSSATAAAAFVDWLDQRYGKSIPGSIAGAAAKSASTLFALPFSNYTGVLIGATAIPVWHRNIKSLPIHFEASAVQSAVSVLELMGYERNPSLNALGIASAIWESWEGYQLESDRDPKLKPLKQGSSGWTTRAGGVLSGPVPLALRIWAAFSPPRRARQIRKAAALSGIAGSLFTRYGWVMAGSESVRQTPGKAGVE
jgi:hypothetical protein